MDLTEAMMEKGQVGPDLLVTWGKVVSTVPVKVRVSGDTLDTAVALRDSGYIVTLNDKVWLMRIGSQWVICGKLIAA